MTNPKLILGLTTWNFGIRSYNWEVHGCTHRESEHQQQKKRVKWKMKDLLIIMSNESSLDRKHSDGTEYSI